MSEKTDSFTEQISKWVVNDYFTPSIKTEVILDTLLTPCIPEILKSQHPDIDAVFLTKEMSICAPPEGRKPADNRGSKIDYVLADKNRRCVYLAELKTTDSSIDAGQLALYTALAGQTKTFGEVLGKRLLAILEASFHIALGEPEGWGDSTLEEAWEKIWNKRRQYQPRDQVPEKSGSCAETARELIKAKGWARRSGLRSRKYVYTLGQLLDYLRGENGGAGLWNSPLELIYLLPRISEDRALSGKNIRTAAFAPCFETADTPLAAIMREIYGERPHNTKQC